MYFKVLAGRAVNVNATAGSTPRPSPRSSSRSPSRETVGMPLQVTPRVSTLMEPILEATGGREGDRAETPRRLPTHLLPKGPPPQTPRANTNLLTLGNLLEG